MKVTALIMAGGEARRLALNVEKPMVKVHGKPMIQWVLKALNSSSRVNKVFVVVSVRTPKTRRFIKRMGFEVLEAPGLGYIEDLRYAVVKLNVASTLIASADLPQLTGQLVDVAVDCYESIRKPALALLAPVKDYEKLGIKPCYEVNVKGVAATPIGVNVIDGRLIERPTLEQRYLLLRLKPPLINVNTVNELRLVRSFMRRGLKVKLMELLKV